LACRCLDRTRSERGVPDERVRCVSSPRMVSERAATPWPSTVRWSVPVCTVGNPSVRAPCADYAVHIARCDRVTAGGWCRSFTPWRSIRLRVLACLFVFSILVLSYFPRLSLFRVQFHSSCSVLSFLSFLIFSSVGPLLLSPYTAPVSRRHTHESLTHCQCVRRSQVLLLSPLHLRYAKCL